METSASRPAVELSQVLRGCMLGMFLLGMATTMYGPALVFLAGETGASEATLGTVFVLHNFGFFASTFSANRLAARLTIRRTMALAPFLIALGALAFITLAFPVNLGAAFLIGLGGGLLEVLLNRLIELLAVETPAAQLNRVHAMWGIGAFTMPLVFAALALVGVEWRAAGALLAGAGALVAGLILRWPHFDVAATPLPALRHLPWRSLAVYTSIIVIYVGAETAVGAWAATFFARLGEGPILGAAATSLFFLTFSIGRIALAGATERLGYARTVRLATLAGGLALLLALFQPAALLAFALAGVAYSVVFPTAFAWGARRHPEIRAQMATLTMAAMGIGATAIPYGIGWMTEWFGVVALPITLVGMSFLVSALAWIEPGR